MRTSHGSTNRDDVPRRTLTIAVASVLSAIALTLGGCSARPGDAPTVEDPPATQASESSTTTQADAARKAQQEARRVIRVGVDSFSGNLNPHVAGNLDPVVSIISDLTLPSAFYEGPDGLVLDENLVLSAEPDDPNAPTRVTYKINPSAQWSDGAPITVSDFQYLAGVIATEPVAAESALYQEISRIDTGVSATEFTVVFSQPFSAWKRLFHHLLPSHIYRGENRPFADMMRESSAASAGAYSVKSFDAGRGIADLQRNDRYWGTGPAQTDRIVFTAVPDVNTGAHMLRTKQLNMLSLQQEATSSLTLGQLANVDQRTIVRPAQLNLLLNSQGKTLGDLQRRRAMMNAINATDIAKIVARDLNAPAPAWNPTADKTEEENKPDNNPTAGDTAETVTIGAPQEDTKAIVAARAVADQLQRAGISARATQFDPSQVFARSNTDELPDAVVMWQRSPQDTADFIAQFQCIKTTQEQGDNWRRGGTDGLEANANAKGGKLHGANPAGVCDPQISQILKQLTTGQTEVDQERTQLDELIASQAIVLPLLGSTSIVAREEHLSGPGGHIEDWPITARAGIFASAPRWRIEDPQEAGSSAAEPTPTDHREPSPTEPSRTEPGRTEPGRTEPSPEEE